MDGTFTAHDRVGGGSEWRTRDGGQRRWLGHGWGGSGVGEFGVFGRDGSHELVVDWVAEV